MKDLARKKKWFVDTIQKRRYQAELQCYQETKKPQGGAMYL